MCLHAVSQILMHRKWLKCTETMSWLCNGLAGIILYVMVIICIYHWFMNVEIKTWYKPWASNDSALWSQENYLVIPAIQGSYCMHSLYNKFNDNIKCIPICYTKQNINQKYMISLLKVMYAQYINNKITLTM